MTTQFVCLSVLLKNDSAQYHTKSNIQNTKNSVEGNREFCALSINESIFVVFSHNHLKEEELSAVAKSSSFVDSTISTHDDKLRCR